MTYVRLGLYAGVRPTPPSRWPRVVAWLVAVSFVVNVVVI